MATAQTAFSAQIQSQRFLGHTSLGPLYVPTNDQDRVASVAAHPGTSSPQRASLMVMTEDGFKPVTSKSDTKRALHELGLARQDLRGKDATLLARSAEAIGGIRSATAISPLHGMLKVDRDVMSSLLNSGIEVHSPKEFQAMRQGTRQLIEEGLQKATLPILQGIKKMAAMFEVFSIYSGQPRNTQWLKDVQSQAEKAAKPLEKAERELQDLAQLDWGMDFDGMESTIGQIEEKLKILKTPSKQIAEITAEIRESGAMRMAATFVMREDGSFEERNQIADRLTGLLGKGTSPLSFTLLDWSQARRRITLRDMAPDLIVEAVVDTTFLATLAAIFSCMGEPNALALSFASMGGAGAAQSAYHYLTGKKAAIAKYDGLASFAEISSLFSLSGMIGMACGGADPTSPVFLATALVGIVANQWRGAAYRIAKPVQERIA